MALTIMLLAAAQILSGCGGCGGSSEGDSTTSGVQGEACNDVNKVTVDAFGIHYPCDICTSPVESNVVNYSDCGTGYQKNDPQSFDSKIVCNTTGEHLISYTSIIHGVSNVLGYSSYSYSGAVSGAYTNAAANPPKDGCSDAGVGQCSALDPNNDIEVLQSGVQINWVCSNEVIDEISQMTVLYDTDNLATNTGWEKRDFKKYVKIFKCNSCTWGWVDGSDGYIITVDDLRYCIVDDVDNDGVPFRTSTVPAVYKYSVYTTNSALENQITPIVSMSADVTFNNCQ
ncbi:MAG: hypothetical protein ACE5GM_05465 [bacterium]